MTSRSARPTMFAAAILVCGLVAPALLAEDAADEVEIKGWIVDEICGRANANPNGKACTLKCQADGAKLVLFEEEQGAIYALSDQAMAEANVGYVKVTGKLDGETIEVAEIEGLDHRLRGEEDEDD